MESMPYIIEKLIIKADKKEYQKHKLPYLFPNINLIRYNIKEEQNYSENSAVYIYSAVICHMCNRPGQHELGLKYIEEASIRLKLRK